jgi:hypothetical protein
MELIKNNYNFMENKKKFKFEYKYIVHTQWWINWYYKKLKWAEKCIKNSAHGKPAFIRIIYDPERYVKF